MLQCRGERLDRPSGKHRDIVHGLGAGRVVIKDNPLALTGLHLLLNLWQQIDWPCWNLTLDTGQEALRG
ncbi:hypothetical protein NKDENANG_00941 [Candidatus Entotheonellaceae bacterium PAL068K]